MLAYCWRKTTIDMDHMDIVLNGPNFFAMICSGMPIIVGSENVGAARLLIILNIKLRREISCLSSLMAANICHLKILKHSCASYCVE